MSYLKKLKAATSRKELAQLLGYKPSALTSIIYRTPLALRYTEFEIDKKSGGKRQIKAPTEKLKKLQTHLSHLLYEILDEIEEERNAKPLAFGFRRERTIVHNATRHKRRRWVLNIDIKDFFPSFNFGRVRGFFLKDKRFELASEVATTIAQIACDGVALPQGAPSSPVIAELISQIIDMRLVRLAKKYGVTYTRYADDITFSTNEKSFPAGIAFQDKADPTNWHLSKELCDKFDSLKFEINHDKTRMQFRGSRQMVTGLTVNEKVNVPSSYYRRARAMCDHLFQTGQYFVDTTPSALPGIPAVPKLTGRLNHLEGVLNFAYGVTQFEERRDLQDQRAKPRAIRKLYRRFLFYKYTMALELPLIITEGKTDVVYLKEAVKRQTKFQPMLGKAGKDGFEHGLRYFNYLGQSHEVMDLGGGTGDLKSIVIDYNRNLYPSAKLHKAFKSQPKKHPVILVLDNDDGLGSVASTVKSNFGVAIDLSTTDSFYHVTDNLYVVKTPEADGKKTCIEDLFPLVWRNYVLNGKKFNSANKIDPATQYSKEVFAKSVVKPNATLIDFCGFDPLLERICEALDHYYTKVLI